MLVEASERNGETHLTGLTDTYVRVDLEGDAPGQTLAQVTIDDLTKDGLRGRIVGG